MTTISQSPAQPSTPNLWGGLVRWIGISAHAVAADWERRAAIKVLLERDDRELLYQPAGQRFAGSGRRSLQSAEWEECGKHRDQAHGS
jgi:hypothetical protein